MSRALFVAILLGCGSTVASAAGPSGIAVHPSPDDSHATLGEAEIEVDPETAYRIVTDYANWRMIFADVRDVIVTRQLGVDARVTLVHPDGNRDNLHFHNRPATRTVWFEDTGGRATVWAEIHFADGHAPGTTQVHTRLYADVHGVLSIVVTDRRLREIREQRVRSDLAHLRAYFAPRLVSEH
jgi:hypothetical protein